jgi:signal recognition particle subunit SEC65
MTAPRKPPGRPRKYGRRCTLTIRLTEPMHATIKEAADKFGRSMSEEIEYRLTRYEWLPSK